MKPIVRYRNRYSVTPEGEVFSHIRSRFLKPYPISKRGYLKVCLSNGQGIVRTEFVHRLVGEAFIANPNNKPHINHINSNPCDNRVENLEWCTPLENVQHSLAAGRFSAGNSRHLSDDEVRKVRLLNHQGLSQKNIGEIFGVTRHVISGILRNKYYIYVN